jgi:hypothetical protein
MVDVLDKVLSFGGIHGAAHRSAGSLDDTYALAPDRTTCPKRISVGAVSLPVRERDAKFIHSGTKSFQLLSVTTA